MFRIDFGLAGMLWQVQSLPKEVKTGLPDCFLRTRSA